MITIAWICLSGVVRAFDARTGVLRWSWDPIAKNTQSPTDSNGTAQTRHTGGFTPKPLLRFCVRIVCQISENTQIRKTADLTCGRSVVLSLTSGCPLYMRRSLSQPLVRRRRGLDREG